MKTFKHIIRKIKFPLQRITRGFSDSDSWNIDLWFCKTVPAILDHLANNTHGYPNRFYEAFELDIASGALTGDQARDKAFKEWQATIRYIASLLREGCSETRLMKNPYEEDYYNAIMGSNIEWDPKIKEKYYDYEIKLERYSKEKLEEGMKLFFENFYDLWD